MLKGLFGNHFVEVFIVIVFGVVVICLVVEVVLVVEGDVFVVVVLDGARTRPPKSSARVAEVERFRDQVRANQCFFNFCLFI